MKFLRYILITAFFVQVFSFSANAQRLVVRATIDENGDTLMLMQLPVFRVFDKKFMKRKMRSKRFTKLMRNVKRVYPYAKLAGKRLGEYNTVLMAMETEAERKEYMKIAENEIKNEFSVELKKLNKSQGLILIKLIDRETGESSYELVKELRGGFVAFFWQSFAKFFGYNLKTKYDPDGRDSDIEYAVQLIEGGWL